MKKSLMAMAFAVMAFSAANATTYQVFDIANAGAWDKEGTGYKQEMKFGDKQFSIVTDQSTSTTELIAPNNNTYAWRVYKASKFTISSDAVAMKKAVIVYDTYSDGKYCLELTLNAGWSGALDNDTYTLTSAGLKTLEAQAVAGQVRIISIVVSDDDNISETPLKPEFTTTGGGSSSGETPETPSTDGVVVFDIANAGTWTPQGSGYICSKTVDGQTFVITTDKGTYNNDLIAPNANSYAWRVYKGSSFTIESSMKIKTLTITYDTYEVDGKGYASELVLSSGWTGKLDGYVFTCTSEGLQTITATSEAQQVRIVKIVASGEGGTPVTPVVSNVVYENTFAGNFDGWTEVNAKNAEEKWWSINSAIGCLQCSSYIAETKANVAADCTLSRSFDLTNRENCELSFEQAYGFVFPTEQSADCTLMIREEGGTWEQLTLANFGERKGTSNWTEFAANTFDISSYDDCKIEIAFRYLNEDAHAMVWELKNFKLTGTDKTAVSEISAEEGVATYYNLQGVRVANPEKGLYIVVKGNKASKVVL